MDDNFSDIGTGQNELTDEDKLKLANIDTEWKNFTLGMNEAKDVLRKCQQDFKATMEEQLDEFKREVTENREKFKIQAPFMVNKEFEAENNKKAFDVIQQFQIECKNLRDREEDMQFGLDIFDIDAQKYHDLAMVEKENASLLTIWQIKQEYDGAWNAWKQIHFTELEFREMEDNATEINFKLNDLSKDERKWKASEHTYDTIQNFLNTVPLLQALRDESMRDRHWKELRIEVKEDFDEHGQDFTLEKVYSLNLLQHQDKIEEICSHARQ